MITRRHLVAAGLGAGFTPLAAAASEAVSEAPWSHDGFAGTLASPRGAGRGLGVLIIAGSGPTDRDGNGPELRTNLYRMIALDLAAAGYTVLRYDKRGVGGSQALLAREEDLSFPLFTADARAALLDLRARPGVRAVVPLGHSEGAMIAIRLARTEKVAGLMLMASPGRRVAAVLSAQIAASGMPPALAGEARRILATLMRGERVAEVPPALGPMFRPSVQPYLISMLNIDPAAELAEVRVPTLILAGGRDLQVGGDDLALLARARPQAWMARLPEANHVMKRAPANRAANLALYRDAAAPLDPGVMPALLGFLSRVA